MPVSWRGEDINDGGPPLLLLADVCFLNRLSKLLIRINNSSLEVEELLRENSSRAPTYTQLSESPRRRHVSHGGRVLEHLILRRRHGSQLTGCLMLGVWREVIVWVFEIT